MLSNNISVIGLGYVGLPLAIILSKKYNIFGFDIDEKRLIPNLEDDIFKEKKFLKIFNKNINKSLFLKKIFTPSKINFICASSNLKSKSITYDTKLHMKIIKNIVSKRINEDITYIILMSTTQVGFSNEVTKYLKHKNLSEKFKFLYTPERIFPSNLFNELINNNRIIGHNDKNSYKVVRKIFKSFVTGNINSVDHTSAELIKIAENTYRSVNIAFSNELLRICMSENIDVSNVINMSNEHPRVNILKPGVGVGGHCIPVDPLFLTNKYKNLKLVESSIYTNQNQPNYLSLKLKKYLKKNKIKNIIFFGCSYKENVNDTRNSPSINLIEDLIKEKSIQTYVCDYLINKNSLKSFNFIDMKNIKFKKFDMAILLVAHDQFKKINFKKFKRFIDISGLYNYENINHL